MYGYIYKTTNLFNGKIYVGQHRSPTFDTSYYGSGLVLCNIINKYGKDSFRCELLEECYSEDELNEREIYWIAQLNATDESIGYNIMLGGYKTCGAKHNDKTKAKISRKKRGCHPNRTYIISDETKSKISASLKSYYKTHNNPRYGVTLSDETKEKIRQANIGKTISEETLAKLRSRPAWNRGIPMTEEGKQHLREINLGKKHSKETKEKMKGKIPWNKGKPLSEETKEKLRQANLGTTQSKEGIEKRIRTMQKRKALGLYIDTRKKQSERQLGKICVSNGVTAKRISPQELDNYISQGYHRGLK